MPYQKKRVLDIVSFCRDLGVTVHFESGWSTLGSSIFNPGGATNHHDVSSPGSSGRGLVKRGRPGVPGPLANFYPERNGDLWVVAAGRANHAGKGGYRGLRYNNSVWGIEIANNGQGESYGADQLRTVLVLNAAFVFVDGIPIELIHSHFEWTPRKIDPAGPPRNRSSSDLRWNMHAFRHDVNNMEVDDMPSAEEVADAFLNAKIGDKPVRNHINDSTVLGYQNKRAIGELQDEIDAIRKQLGSRKFDHEFGAIRRSLRKGFEALGVPVKYPTKDHGPDEVEA